MVFALAGDSTITKFFFGVALFLVAFLAVVFFVVFVVVAVAIDYFLVML